jgi:excisionase family DNA binding protein
MAKKPTSLLTEKEVATLLRVAPSTLRNARSTGKGALAALPYIRIGRLVRYREADVQKFLARKGGHR